jgi:hypothetical protein
VLDAVADRWTSHKDHHLLHQGCGCFPFSKPSQENLRHLPVHLQLRWGTTARVAAWSSFGVQESLRQVVLWAALPRRQSSGGIVFRGDGEVDEAAEPW